MQEYKFIKAWREWVVGDSLFPNQSISGQEFAWLRNHNMIVLARDYVPPEPVVKPAEIPIPPVETAAYGPADFRKRGPGRPRKESSEALKESEE